MPDRVNALPAIYQYWETRGSKPKFIDGLRDIATRNAGVPLMLVTPETLPSFVAEMPPAINEIGEMAHKADMLRTMLILRHGGMWLDSDAIVLRPLRALFDYLDEFDFVGFDDLSFFKRSKVRVNCFLSRPNGRIVSEWVRLQHQKLPRTTFGWEEIGSDLLTGICRENRRLVKLLPFSLISPVGWDRVDAFARSGNAGPILRDCLMVMMSNKSLSDRRSPLVDMTVEEIAARDWLISDIVRHALGQPSLHNTSRKPMG
jgi:hypothetical protein